MEQKTWNRSQALWTSDPITEDPTGKLECHGIGDEDES